MINFLKGLTAAVIGGVVNTLVDVFSRSNGEHINLHRLGNLAAVGGLLGLVMYIKQSPFLTDEQQSAMAWVKARQQEEAQGPGPVTQ